MFVRKDWKRVVLIFASLLLLCAGGCSSEKGDGEAAKEEGTSSSSTTSASTQGSSEGVGTKGGGKAGNPQNAAEERRKRLAIVFSSLYCAQKNGTKGDRSELYTQHGFSDGAEWTQKWHREGKKDAKWAEGVITAAMKSSCE